MVSYRRHKRTLWPSSVSTTIPGTLKPAHKPALVSEIEGYIQREIYLLEKNGAATPENTFQMYRECFGVFSSHFHDYAPFLSRVMQHFDSVMLRVNQMTYQNTSMKQELDTVHDHHEALLRLERAKHFKERAILEENLLEVRNMFNESQRQLNEMSKKLQHHQFQVDKRQEEFEELHNRANTIAQALREQSVRHGRFFQQLKTITSDRDRLQQIVNQFQEQLLVYQERETTGAFDSVNSRGKELIDPKVSSKAKGGRQIKNAVSKAKQQSNAVIGLQGIEDEDMNLKSHDLPISESFRDFPLKSTTRHENKDQPLTPRAQWKRLVCHLPDICLDLDQSSDDILSEVIEIIDDLNVRLQKAQKQVKDLVVLGQWLEEEGLTEYELKNKMKTFIGLGTGPHIPQYLRVHGPIRNRYFKKGEVEGLLERIWKERKAELISLMNTEGANLNFIRLHRTSFESYLSEWLKRETGSSRLAIELAYNIIDGCERYRNDPDCDLFLRIARGQLSEEIYIDQFQFVENLHKLFIKLDKDDSKFVPRSLAFRLLNNYFATTSTDNLMKLRYALMTDFSGETVWYNQLFHNDEEGNQSRFVVMMRHIHLRDCVEFSVDVEEELRSRVDSEGMLPLRSAWDAIMKLDPKKNEEEVLSMLSLAADSLVSVEQIITPKVGFERFPLEDFLTRLRKGLFKRSTKQERIALQEDRPNDGEGNCGLLSDTTIQQSVVAPDSAGETITKINAADGTGDAFI